MTRHCLLASCLFLLLLAAGSASRAETSPAEPRTLDQARARAAERGVPVLIDLFATWCGPCKVFDRDATQNAELRAALERVVLFKIDGETPEGSLIARAHKQTGFPTYVLETAEGEAIHQWMGYERQAFLDNLDAALADPVSIEERASRFGPQSSRQKSGPQPGSAQDAVLLAMYHASRGETEASFSFYEKAQQLNDDPEVDYSTQVFVVAFDGYRDGKIDADQVARAGKLVLEWPGCRVQDAFALTRYMSAVARNENNPDILVPFLDAAMQRSENETDARILAMRKAVKLEHTLYVQKDVAAAVALYKERLPANWQQDANALNSFAWWCFENEINLEEAETMARNGVELAQPGQQKAMVLDTLAEICNLRGSCRDAVAFIEQAIAEDPGRPHYKEQLERFRRELAAQEASG